jgi:hypothetical protein
MSDLQATIFDQVRAILRRRDVDVEVGLDSDFFDDLMLDSLEVAELSASLEDGLGSDPYSAGDVPRTVRQVLGFYQQQPA